MKMCVRLPVVETMVFPCRVNKYLKTYLRLIGNQFPVAAVAFVQLHVPEKSERTRIY